MTKRVTATDAMRVLERLVKASWNPSLRKAKPIVFDLIFEQWTLDTRQPEPISQRVDQDAALTVHCAPESLVRLLTEPGFVPEDFEIFARGDRAALDPLIQALNAKQNWLALRASKGM